MLSLTPKALPPLSHPPLTRPKALPPLSHRGGGRVQERHPALSEVAALAGGHNPDSESESDDDAGGGGAGGTGKGRMIKELFPSRSVCGGCTGEEAVCKTCLLVRATFNWSYFTRSVRVCVGACVCASAIPLLCFY